MQNDEYTPEDVLDEEQNDTEDSTLEDSSAPNWEDEAKKAKALALKWEAIAKRKAKRETEQKNLLKETNVSAEELKLIARGLSDEDIVQAQVIAKGKGITLPEATKDPMFVAYQDKLKEVQRSEEAKLGASRGSGQVNTETFKSGMSREDHKALWQKQNS